MWEQLKRIIKPNGAIVLFGSEPFSSALRMSNIKQYKYDWVWDKKSVSNPQLSKIQPMKSFENVLVFGFKKINYYPQGLIKREKPDVRKNKSNETEKLKHNSRNAYVSEYTNYPSMLNSLKYPREHNNNTLHPTQKPVALMEYLIKTYTNENETVLDFTMGSGSTMIACLNTNRKGIGIELDKHYFDVANKRINEHKATLDAVF